MELLLPRPAGDFALALSPLTADMNLLALPCERTSGSVGNEKVSRGRLRSYSSMRPVAEEEI